MYQLQNRAQINNIKILITRSSVKKMHLKTESGNTQLGL